MKETKHKLIVLMFVFLLGIMAIQLRVNATNENIKILHNIDDERLIYIKGNLDKDFEFAFSNDKDADKFSLTYVSAETDSEDNANKVAYINSSMISMFENPTYMWARIGDEYIINGIEINLDEEIYAYDLQYASEITKIIKVDTTKVDKKEEEIDGKKITTTIGKVVLTDKKDNLDYEYILVKLPVSEEYEELVNLANRISKFNDKTDIYTKIDIYENFLDMFYNLIPEDSEKWVKLEGNEILQPEDSQSGEQYILWIRESENGDPINFDIQFLTAHREEAKQSIIEKITTKLPVTYDNNILFVVLGILVIAAVLVYVRMSNLKKNEEK